MKISGMRLCVFLLGHFAWGKCLAFVATSSLPTPPLLPTTTATPTISSRTTIYDSANNRLPVVRRRISPRMQKEQDDNNDNNDKTVNQSKTGNQQYRNLATEILSNFMQKTTKNENPKQQQGEGGVLSVVDQIDFKAPKRPIPDLNTLAAVLDYELTQTEWFVTGKVNPVYFADTFRFQDPDVTLEGIEAYARGVNTLFDQTTSRAEVIQTTVTTTTRTTNNPPQDQQIITCTWRLSGKANIGPTGLLIKPYIVYTDFYVENGLVVRQEDRFDLPQWDILLSSLFPFLIGKLTQPPAPPVPPRIVPQPKILQTNSKGWTMNGGKDSPFAVFADFFKAR